MKNKILTIDVLRAVHIRRAWQSLAQKRLKRMSDLRTLHLARRKLRCDHSDKVYDTTTSGGRKFQWCATCKSIVPAVVDAWPTIQAFPLFVRAPCSTPYHRHIWLRNGVILRQNVAQPNVFDILVAHDVVWKNTGTFTGHVWDKIVRVLDNHVVRDTPADHLFDELQCAIYGRAWWTPRRTT